MSKPTNEALREECLEKWFCEENMDNTNNRSLEQRMDIVINHVMDAVVESMLEYNGKDSKMNYLQVVNKLRPSK